jgi:MoxR-like ATPase
MILILLRIKSKISVILMGETGCGKTSLKKTICDLCGYNLLKITINASFNDNDIVSFIVKNKLNEENIEYEENEDERFEIESRGLSSLSKFQESNFEESENKNKYDKNKINIVFFDEFNTCNSQGLFTEIMCKHTVQGKKIKDN